MKCKEFKIKILPFLNGDPIDNKEEFLKHLASCQKCKEEFEKSKKILAAIDKVNFNIEVDTENFLKDFYKKVDSFENSSEHATENKNYFKQILTARMLVPVSLLLIVLFGVLIFKFSTVKLKNENDLSLNPNEMVELLENMEVYEYLDCFSNLDEFLDTATSQIYETPDQILKGEI